MSVGDPEDRPVVEAFDVEGRPGYLMRRGVKHLSTVWAAHSVGMTIPQFAILVELDQSPGLDQRALGDRVLVDPSTTAEMCRRLLERGYIARERDAHDRRRYLVRITPAGRARLKPALPLVDSVDEVLLSRLTPSERRRFVQLFRKVLELDRE